MDRDATQARIVARATSDAGFRSRLLADPGAAIADELGAPLPAGLEIAVVEETPGKLYLVLPAAVDTISDAELETVAGGSQPFWPKFPG